jgi:hypothetical protein
VVKKASGSPSKSACFSASSSTNNTRDVAPDQPRLARPALRVGPHETLAGHSEVKAVAVNLLHVRQAECEPTNVVGVSHRDGFRIAPAAYAQAKQ